MAAVSNAESQAPTTTDERVGVPSGWSYTSDRFQTLPATDEWWRGFNDPVLDELIDLVTDNNFNVAIAAHRIELSRQAMRQAKSGYYPSVSIGAGWTGARTSGYTGRTPGPAMTTDYFSASVDASWEIDLFGRVREQVKQRGAQYEASAADYVAAMNSLCAEIATDYMRLRMCQEQLDVARNHLESQGRALAIAQARHEAGLNSGLDVAQATTVYNSTEATIPAIETNITLSINALALLTGVYPEQLRDRLTKPLPLPDWRRIVAVGVPADLLRRRPDVRAAEADMAAAAAQVGIAKRDFLPTLSIDGSVGVAAHKPGDLAHHNAITYSVAPRLSWTIFDGMARNAALASAKQQMLIAIDNYNLTLMTAAQEVENAMASYLGDLRTIASLEKVVTQAQKEVDMSLDLYKQGLSDFLSVAQAQITVLQYADQLATAHASASTSLIALYKALGGGWNGQQY